MQFDLTKSIQILSRTPAVLKAYLNNLPDGWTRENEGSDTWSAYDIVGHLIHGEKTDWIVRARIILSKDDGDKTFEPFDRLAQFDRDQNQPISELLDEFAELRLNNLQELKEMDIREWDLNKTGIHPDLGETTLSQLLSTWVVHDMGHIAQISRVMAKQYKDEVGPWSAYLSILK